ncbi:MAG: hypothetical protein EAZ95_12495 [Bacteroidetes bacterium]|nr:MAG: hypothetical protein EAZ95_12495 [Bacteroidota bacterium]
MPIEAYDKIGLPKVQKNKICLIFAYMKKHYFLLLWVLGVACLHRYAQSCGVGLTYDSQNYVWASNTWAGKGILQNHDGVPFLQQPPLFPLFLSLFVPYQLIIISWFNTFCLGLVVWIWGILGGKLLESRVWWALYVGLLGLATPLFLVHQFLWSEPLFLVLMSVHLWALYQYQQGRQGGYLVLMAVASALLCLQRSIGFVFVFGTIAGLLLQKDTRNKLFPVLAYSAGALLPFLGWVLVVLAQKTPTEFAETYGIQDNFVAGILMLVESLALWFLPAQVPLVGKVFFCALCAFWVGKACLLLKQGVFLRSLACSILLYLLVLCLKKSDFSDTERFVAVLYPLVLLLLFQPLPSPTPARWWVLCVCLLCLYPVGRCLKNIVFWKEVQCKK